MYIIAIDIGTTSCKGLLLGDMKEELKVLKVPYPTLSPQTNYKEQDPIVLYEAVVKCIRSIATDLDEGLVGISFSVAMHSLIAVDEQGLPLTNCIIWSDARSEEYANQLKNTDLGKSIYRHTGTPIHPMSPLCKIAWLRDHQAEVFEKTHQFLSIKSYLFYRFFGVFVEDYSLASATGLFDIESKTWFAPALEFAGITADRLPKPVSVEEIFLEMNPKVADACGIQKDLPVVIGASDGCLANLGMAALETGATVITIGTSAAIRQISKTIIANEEQQLFNYLLTDDNYVNGGASNNGAVLLEWVANLLKTPQADLYEQIEQLDSQCKTSEGLFFLPYLLGERAPIWDANASGAFIGLRTSHTPAHLLRATLEGILFNLLQIQKAMEIDGANTQRIYVSGGFTQSKFWVQLLADIFACEVVLPKSGEASAHGAAILGLHALGYLDRFEDYPFFKTGKKVIQPNLEANKIYQKYFDIYGQLYEELKTSLDKIAILR